jgi:hypothetical protein
MIHKTGYDSFQRKTMEGIVRLFFGHASYYAKNAFCEYSRAGLVCRPRGRQTRPALPANYVCADLKFSQRCTKEGVVHV